ncbi:MAG: hypothetical protein F9K24_17955 [Leptonema illini]|uniref:Diaminopimelate decarboxylase n=1 Tax=Leptonema illini TaxID=183 RepID=A0A833GYW8_9LEPT|nr:MAG: hypothetical protein F9K24_17955 [Leptonema illini]
MHAVLQTVEFGEWFSSLPEAQKEAVFAAVSVLREFGPGLGRPRVNTLKGSRHANLKELRVQSGGQPLRVLFAFDPRRNIVLLMGGNKKGAKRFYEIMVPRVERLLDEYLEGQRDGR